MPLLPTDSFENHIAEEKRICRSHYRKIRKKLSPESKNLLDSALFSNTISLSCFRDADTILFYYPVNSEPNLLHLARYALQNGKKAAFPISYPQSCRLTFHSVTRLDEFVEGSYSIPEPLISLPPITDYSKSLCIVPGLAFDHLGHRIGYGKGFYDRFLSTFNGVSIGLVYSLCLADVLPHNQYDHTVDWIITEKGDMKPYEIFS